MVWLNLSIHAAAHHLRRQMLMTHYLVATRVFVAVALAAAVLIAPSQSARAQMPLTTAGSNEPAAVVIEEPKSKEAVREMVARLSDDTVRSLLIERLDAVAEANAVGEANQKQALDVLLGGLQNQWNNASHAISMIHTIPQMLRDVHAKISESLPPDGFSLLWMVVLVAIAAGLLAERLVARIFRRRKQELIDAVATTLWGILKILYTRLSFDVLGVLAFLTLGSIVIANFYPADSHASRLARTTSSTKVMPRNCSPSP